MDEEFPNDNGECLADLSPEEKMRQEMQALQLPPELTQYALVDIYDMPPAGDKKDLATEDAIPDEARNRIWEYNRTKINSAMHLFLLDFGRMPSHTELAADTGISRQTIAKHLKSYNRHPQHGEEIEQFRSLETRVLSTLATLALKDDMTAARMYYKVMHKAYRQPEMVEVEPNSWYYCGVNGRVLSRYHLEQLKQEQLNEIEAILKQPIPGRETEEDLLVQDLAPEAREEAKNQYWQRNHQCIVEAVAQWLDKNKTMPSHTELATKTGLTRKTISRHLNNFRVHPFYEAELEQYHALSARLLNVVGNLAVKGNLKAVGIYFHLVNEVYTKSEDAAAWLARRRECALVNNTRVNQQMIDQLTEEQRQAIANILASR